MRKFEDLRTTTNNSVYRRIHITNVTGCCMACKRRRRKLARSWKEHRKTKYKDQKIF